METRTIHLKMKMSDVVHQNYRLIPTLDRFGIRLGFGDKNLQEVCEKAGVDALFLVELLNAFTNLEYTSSSYVKEIDVLLLLKYLKKTHSSYLEDWVVAIEKMIEGLKELGEDEGYIDLILKFFKGYKSELTAHIRREEEVVFPYIETLNSVIEKGNMSDVERKLVKNYSMKIFGAEHDDISLKLNDLKNIMIKYIVTPKNTVQYYAIIQELFKLEEDVEHHTRVEDKILIPCVSFMEKKVEKILRECEK